jgi:3',5'-cyclic AMP phosphodiesterase CpdA
MGKAETLRRWGLAALIAALATSAGLTETARGFVFEDLDGNGLRDGAEPGIAGVAVSNGRDVVVTGKNGQYELAVEDGTILFVTKPSGYAPVLDENRLPCFYYIHDPDGSPAEPRLRYRGVAPSGPLPDSVDFPLHGVDESERFKVVLWADTQPQTAAEVGYVRDAVVDELVGVDAAFGMTLGDIMYDDLSLYQRYKRIVSRIGIPWYHVPGNHDLNYQALDDEHSLETYKRHFGPPYYSFDYGSAHFVVLDDVDYLGSNAGMDSPQPRGQGKYEGRISEEQLEWLSNDLSLVPADRLVVLTMHIPFTSYYRADDARRRVENRAELLALLEGFENVLSLSGHMHTTEHHYFGRDEGFPGARPLHQHVLGTVAGSWWSGPFDEHGIPTSHQRDGSPNGYYLMEVDGTQAGLRFKAAGKPADHQMRIMLDGSFHRYREAGIRDFRMGQLLGSPLDLDQLHATEIVVNLFEGGPGSEVVCQVDDRPPMALERVHRHDPFIEELFLRNEETLKPWVKVEPSSHLWAGRLPTDLKPGVHTISVQAKDEYGHTHTAHEVLEIVSGGGGGGD